MIRNIIELGAKKRTERFIPTLVQSHRHRGCMYSIGLFRPRFLCPNPSEFRPTHCSTRDRFLSLSLELIHSEWLDTNCPKMGRARRRRRELLRPRPSASIPSWPRTSAFSQLRSGCCLLNSRLPHPLTLSPLLSAPPRGFRVSRWKNVAPRSHMGAISKRIWQNDSDI